MDKTLIITTGTNTMVTLMLPSLPPNEMTINQL
jgi:hypothetical protein